MLWGWFPVFRFPLPDFVIKLFKTPSQKVGRDYHLSTLTVEYNATKYQFKNDQKIIIGGHTHSPFVSAREGYTIANCGDMVDSFTRLEIDGDNVAQK